jgi:hypothetical protein
MVDLDRMSIVWQLNTTITRKEIRRVVSILLSSNLLGYHTSGHCMSVPMHTSLVLTGIVFLVTNGMFYT